MSTFKVGDIVVDVPYRRNVICMVDKVYKETYFVKTLAHGYNTENAMLFNSNKQAAWHVEGKDLELLASKADIPKYHERARTAVVIHTLKGWR